MVQMVENWALLTCRLESLRQEDQHVELTTVLESVTPVAPYPNLFDSRVGTRLVLKLRGDMPAIAPGAAFSVMARLADNVTAWADPASIKLV
jgi:hypothetical protein